MPKANIANFLENSLKRQTLLEILLQTLHYRALKIDWLVYWLCQNSKFYSKFYCWTQPRPINFLPTSCMMKQQMSGSKASVYYWGTFVKESFIIQIRIWSDIIFVTDVVHLCLTFSFHTVFANFSSKAELSRSAYPMARNQPLTNPCEELIFFVTSHKSK